MERISKINILNEEMLFDNQVHCEVVINFKNGESISSTYGKINTLNINREGTSFQNKVIEVAKLSSAIDDVTDGIISFKNCIFLGECDFNFGDFTAAVRFENCIFTKNFSIFGDFRRVVSFEKSTFLNSKVSFQECSLDHFVFNLVTMINSNIDFQETSFFSSNLSFGNLFLENSTMSFVNSSFPKNGNLLDLIAIESDQNSKISFVMVDFNFVEVRLYHSKINYLEFIDCTFECNRFDFDLSCETLIIQDCKNFRIMTLYKLENLNNLNIYNLINTGKILVNQNPDYYLKALKTKKEIIRISGRKYEASTNSKFKKQLYVLLDFYDISQAYYRKLIQKEIEVSNEIERLLAEEKEDMKIFLSYSWKDEKLADNIDEKFNKIGITLVRDKRDIGYTQSIGIFMKGIRRGDFSLILISDDYLKSVNCMNEINEFVKDDDYKERILPIIKKGTNIFNAMDRSKYITFWNQKYLALVKEITKINKEAEFYDSRDLIKDLLKYQEIKVKISDFLSEVADMSMIKTNTQDEITDEELNEIKKRIFSSSTFLA